MFVVGEQLCVEKYLSLPEMIGRDKHNALKRIKDRIAKRLQSSKCRLLSQGGRKVMIKSILQAIPTYAMSVFALPIKLCNQIDSLIKNFLWRQNSDKRPISWVNWKWLCKSKTLGGMDFRDMRLFNLALLAKQGWRLIQAQETLLFKVMKACYFPYSTFVNAKKSWNSSFTWQSIWRTKDLLDYGTRWRVGNGSSISILEDKWIPSLVGFCLRSSIGTFAKGELVSSLIDKNRGTWDACLIQESFSHTEAQAIFQRPLSKNLMEDVLIWHYERKGYYTVKSGYHLACKLEQVPDVRFSAEIEEDKAALKVIWNANVPPKIKNFHWSLYHRILPVMENLHQKNINVDLTCFRCKEQVETISHAIRECPAAVDVRTMVEDLFRTSWNPIR